MRSNLQRLYGSKIRLAVTVAILLFIFFLGWRLVAWGQKFKKDTGLSATTVAKLIFNGGIPLASTNGRTNLLILGIGGGTHEGADLTDTMLILSIDTVGQKTALISVPRDIWSMTLQDKVNSAYHYGEEKEKGGGLTLAKSITEDVVGMPMHYSFVIDFSQFTKIIDLIGGIDVNVQTAFTDKEYPIEGKENDLCGGDPTYRCRYETIHFDTGTTHMDGTTALKYVRSRHAEGAEGTDFARSRRQQDVIVALRKRIVTPSILMHPGLAIRLFRSFDDATDMDMTIGVLLTIGKKMVKVQPSTIEKISFEDQLVNPPEFQYGGRYVLVPKESLDQIHEFIKSKL